MLKTFLIAGSVLILLLGAAGISMAAAQDSQPDGPLGGLREWSRQMQQIWERLRLQAQTHQVQRNSQMGTEAGLQDQNRIRLQEQYQIRSQTQDRLQLQENLQQSLHIRVTDKGGGNPWTTGTPIPSSGYGPGPGPDSPCLCTPQEQNRKGLNKP